MENAYFVQKLDKKRLNKSVLFQLIIRFVIIVINVYKISQYAKFVDNHRFVDQLLKQMN